jgi:2-polyprenyl-3-methyl-5-hydroxy-6-metoxy-1,4-benzoquinol methylase
MVVVSVDSRVHERFCEWRQSGRDRPAGASCEWTACRRTRSGYSDRELWGQGGAQHDSSATKRDTDAPSGTFDKWIAVQAAQALDEGGSAGAYDEHTGWGVHEGTVCPVIHIPEEALAELLSLAGVDQGGHTLLDLGCGDGRVVVAAAKTGAAGVGLDINPSLVRGAQRRADGPPAPRARPPHPAPAAPAAPSVSAERARRQRRASAHARSLRNATSCRSTSETLRAPAAPRSPDPPAGAEAGAAAGAAGRRYPKRR